MMLNHYRLGNSATGFLWRSEVLLMIRHCPFAPCHNRHQAADHSFVFRGENAGDVVQLIEWHFVLRRTFVYGIGIHPAIIHHDGQAVDIGFFGDALNA